MPAPLHPVREAQLLMGLLTESLMQVSPPARSRWIVQAVPELLQLMATHPAATPGPTATPAGDAGARSSIWASSSGTVAPTETSAAAGGPGASGSGQGPLAHWTYGDDLVVALVSASRGVPVEALLDALAQPAEWDPGPPVAAASSFDRGLGASGRGPGTAPGGPARRAQQHENDAAFDTGGGSGSAGGGTPSQPPAARGP